MEHCVPLVARPRRDAILHAIAEHDNGWAGVDAAPMVKAMREMSCKAGRLPLQPTPTESLDFDQPAFPLGLADVVYRRQPRPPDRTEPAMTKEGTPHVPPEQVFPGQNCNPLR